MKHLKKYKLFESYSENINELNDILLELVDLNYVTDVQERKTIQTYINGKKINNPDSIRVSIKGSFFNFNYDDVKEVFERMIDYMKDEGFYILNVYYSTPEYPSTLNLIGYENNKLHFFGKEVDNFHSLLIYFAKNEKTEMGTIDSFFKGY